MSFGIKNNIDWQDITDRELPKELLTPLDQMKQVDIMTTTIMQARWWADGVLYLPNFLPTDLIDKYCEVRSKLDAPGGWESPVPYLHVKELRDISLYRPLMAVMKSLIGEDMGLHLNLTGWVSTERDLHQDSYLNPDFVGTRYIAAWMALDDIHADSGPFQFVQGSHKWPVIRRDKIFKYLTKEEQINEAWPSLTQGWVAEACMKEILRRNTEVSTYLPRRGDVLLWHSNLVHRGSPATKPGMQRKALISHYSALSVRSDMPERRKHDNGETYFWFDRKLK